MQTLEGSGLCSVVPPDFFPVADRFIPGLAVPKCWLMSVLS